MPGCIIYEIVKAHGNLIHGAPGRAANLVKTEAAESLAITSIRTSLSAAVQRTRPVINAGTECHVREAAVLGRTVKWEIANEDLARQAIL
jgi:hypothetical protein